MDYTILGIDQGNGNVKTRACVFPCGFKKQETKPSELFTKDILEYKGSYYSNEYIKQYQAICSEVDVIMKSICKEFGNPSVEKMTQYTPIILQRWPNIKNQKVEMKDMELQPFLNWQETPYQSPDWWKPYNDVKHKRIDNYKNANLKNVLNALAGLYILCNYFVKEIGDRDNTYDVPNDISHLFEMVNYSTTHKVIGRNTYDITESDIAAMFANN